MEMHELIIGNINQIHTDLDIFSLQQNVIYLPTRVCRYKLLIFFLSLFYYLFSCWRRGETSTGNFIVFLLIHGNILIPDVLDVQLRICMLSRSFGKFLFLIFMDKKIFMKFYSLYFPSFYVFI